MPAVAPPRIDRTLAPGYQNGQVPSYNSATGRFDPQFPSLEGEGVDSTNDNVLDWNIARVFLRTLVADTTFIFENVRPGRTIHLFITGNGLFTYTLPTVIWDAVVASGFITGQRTVHLTFTALAVDPLHLISASFLSPEENQQTFSVDFIVAAPSVPLLDPTTFGVTFPTPLNSPPIYVAKPLLIKEHPEDDNVVAVSIDSVTRFGYNINFNGQFRPGQLLHCNCIPVPMPSQSTQRILITSELVGLDTIHVSFDPPVSTIPSRIEHPIFEKSSPDEDNVQVLNIDSITLEGYNVNIMPGAILNQILHCSHLP